ncbi:uncharacterized protein TrAFT101_001244 [Trichoderma asperellum]|uniref:Uncharacterized protein n=1 Tax=Trichoderma asperellum (strain ATCC 204424 / CBS 433.97 / NBRC 101777) TaxID=1042311 RepID=A0A2T3ZLX7_TRIA4|nr:hypothetical protein M441DRAFT_65445 [Trichoderma asperellum CBS 433.97]PTB45810.1 hypothetical protein M441DRAFT_65445 [Trichoderma asperellum CBS 433.97]UKZ85380.1 hypothetical protein TrAFT101_001244 [Trichoderma asperellum]
MKAINVALLFYTAFAIEAATAATRLELPQHRHQRRLFQSNSTLENVQGSLLSTGNTAVEDTLWKPTEFATKYNKLSISKTDSAPTAEFNATEGSFLYQASPSTSSSPSTTPVPSAEVDDLKRPTSLSATDSIHETGEHSQISTPIPNYIIESSSSTLSTTSWRNVDASVFSSVVPTTGGKFNIFPTNSSLINTTSIVPCTPLPGDRAVTEYSVVYTTTITFYGNSTDYTPPYSPITTPNYCSPTGEALITFYSTTHISNSTAPETAATFSTASATIDFSIPALAAPLPTITFSFDLPEIITPAPDATGGNGGGITVTMRPFLSFTRRIITFITTDKNPSVVFAPEPTPDFSPTWITGDIGDGIHRTRDVIDNPPTGTPISNLLQSVKQPPAPTFRVTAGGDQVIINGKTVSGLRPSQTTTITVGTDVFTIFPTAVVGLGSTVTKPAPQEVSTPTPAVTSGVLGGVPVIISGTKAVVDGITLSISPEKATTTISGQRVVFGTGIIAVGHETLIFQDLSPRPTHDIVTGGEMVTAIGSSIVVLHSTTITYGANIAPKQTIINGETITIGPRGVSLHSTILGGPSANSTNTEYEIVGGITVGKLLPSLVVVNGVTYSINIDGDLSNVETTVIDNQTITIGPNGLILSSQTLTYPESSVTATLLPSMPNFPAKTGNQDDLGGDDESSAVSIRLELSALFICLAISVWVTI